MRFHFFPLRFEFVARDPLYFPPWKAGNMLRGAMGAVLARKLGGPSGLADPPRPFVIRARHLDGLGLQPGEPFHFDLHVFSLDREVLDSLICSSAALSREGLGTRRGKVELRRILRLALNGVPEQIIDGDSGPAEPVVVDLSPAAWAPARIRVDFLSPTELKHNHRIASRPEFPILFGRVRDRIGTLSALYGAGPLAIDFRAAGERAAAVRMTGCEVGRLEVERRSTRTGQTHSIGGFVGSAEYEGEMAEFLPYLEAARWTGVGRHAVWGNGEISVKA